jgi:hypothetical protein
MRPPSILGFTKLYHYVKSKRIAKSHPGAAEHEIKRKATGCEVTALPSNSDYRM